MSAIFVKMPPATRRAAAPSDSPIAKPMKHLPAYSCGMSVKIISMMASSMLMSIMPMLMPALERDRVDVKVRLAPEARERGARVREGVHSNAEERDGRASGDPKDAEEKDEEHDAGRLSLQNARSR